jgi:transposase
METMAGKQARRRRSFTPEFKAEVVALVRRPGNTAGSVAREMELTDSAVREWGPAGRA